MIRARYTGKAVVGVVLSLLLSLGCTPPAPWASPETRGAIGEGVPATPTEPTQTAAVATSKPTQVVAPAANPAANLPTAAVRRGPIEALLPLSGRVGAQEEVELSFPMAARVANVAVAPGQPVDEGQLLVEIDTVGLEAELGAARKRLETAEAKHAKARGVIEERLSVVEGDLERLAAGPSTSERLTAEGSITSARAAVQRAEADLANLTAPPNAREVQAAEQEVTAARVAVQKAEQEWARVTSGPDPTELRKAESDVATAQSGLDKARAELDRLAKGPDPYEVKTAQHQLQQAKADVLAAESAAQTQVQQATLELRAAEDKTPIEQAKAAVRAAESAKSNKDSRAARNAAIQQARLGVQAAEQRQAQARERAQLALQSAQQRLVETRAKGQLTLRTAEERLAQASEGPQAWEIDVARRGVENAQRTLEEANQQLEAVHGGGNPAVRATAELALQTARGSLARAESRLQELRTGAPPDQVAAARTAVQAARTSLRATEARVAELNEPQPADLAQMRDAEAKVAALRALLEGSVDEAEASPDRTPDRDAAEFIQGRKSVDQERAQAETLERSLAAARLVAPSPGVVADVRVHPGDPVSPGRAAVTLAQSSDALIRAELPERDAGRVAVGQQATIQVEGRSDEKLGARLAGILEAGGLRVALFEVPWPTVRPSLGTMAQVVVTVQRKDDALIVPQRAVRTVSGRRYVDVLDGANQRRTEVELGITGATEVEILGGLREGQLVLLGS